MALQHTVRIERLRSPAPGARPPAREVAEQFAPDYITWGDTELAPEAIHQLGLAEVDRITEEMAAILRSQGFTTGSVGERTTALGAEERFLYPNTDEGRAELLASLTVMVDGIADLVITGDRDDQVTASVSRNPADSWQDVWKAPGMQGLDDLAEVIPRPL